MRMQECLVTKSLTDYLPLNETLTQEYVFGEGKIDEYLKESTNQKHYPYIYINKEFVGDHRTVAYMDYQGTLINTVGLVFLGMLIFFHLVCSFVPVVNEKCSKVYGSLSLIL